MRTTVTIDDRLLRQAKLAAARSGRTLSDLVDDGLRLLLSHRTMGEQQPVTLPVFGGSGLLPGVDLDDKEVLTALLDEAERVLLADVDVLLQAGSTASRPPVAARTAGRRDARGDLAAHLSRG